MSEMGFILSLVARNLRSDVSAPGVAQNGEFVFISVKSGFVLTFF